MTLFLCIIRRHICCSSSQTQETGVAPSQNSGRSCNFNRGIPIAVVCSAHNKVYLHRTRRSPVGPELLSYRSAIARLLAAAHSDSLSSSEPIALAVDARSTGLSAVHLETARIYISLSSLPATFHRLTNHHRPSSLEPLFRSVRSFFFSSARWDTAWPCGCPRERSDGHFQFASTSPMGNQVSSITFMA